MAFSGHRVRFFFLSDSLAEYRLGLGRFQCLYWCGGGRLLQSLDLLFAGDTQCSTVTAKAPGKGLDLCRCRSGLALDEAEEAVKVNDRDT